MPAPPPSPSSWSRRCARNFPAFLSFPPRFLPVRFCFEGLTFFFDIDIDIYISCLVLKRPVGQTTMSVGY